MVTITPTTPTTATATATATVTTSARCRRRPNRVPMRPPARPTEEGRPQLLPPRRRWAWTRTTVQKRGRMRRWERRRSRRTRMKTMTKSLRPRAVPMPVRRRRPPLAMPLAMPSEGMSTEIDSAVSRTVPSEGGESLGGCAGCTTMNSRREILPLQPPLRRRRPLRGLNPSTLLRKKAIVFAETRTADGCVTSPTVPSAQGESMGGCAGPIIVGSRRGTQPPPRWRRRRLLPMPSVGLDLSLPPEVALQGWRMPTPRRRSVPSSSRRRRRNHSYRRPSLAAFTMDGTAASSWHPADLSARLPMIRARMRMPTPK
mmetsp:Transcript_15345/g.44399  ORF Transcript_15345/g.44399 Transcript_15345/m.44399 type:complete len:314 (+) Transcript_15345:404-1345(+)